MKYSEILSTLRENGNFRSIPGDSRGKGLTDLSSNDYLGLAEDTAMRRAFMTEAMERDLPLTSSASRLLAAGQDEYLRLESLLSELYGGRAALLHNSGYHANTGLVQALASDGDTLIVADKLVHASIIDGIMLSKAPFERYRHNDYEHLRSILRRKAGDYGRVLIISESVFSMDGDFADIDTLASIRAEHDNALLYIDEAHAFGVCGPGGLGCAAASPSGHLVDVTVGTFGKAAASAGAFSIMSRELRDLAVNRARSLIFSTALPPLNTAWTRYLVERLADMEPRREKLRRLAKLLKEAVGGEGEASHIRPLITGDAALATNLSARLLEEGFKVLPIRTPTVPPGTERLRFSLSASTDEAEIIRLANVLKHLRKA